LSTWLKPTLRLVLCGGPSWRTELRLLRPLLGDDAVLDLVVSRLRNDLLLDQLVLRAVWTVLDDLLRVSVAYPGQRLKLIDGGCIDIHQPGGGRALGRLFGGIGLLRFRLFGGRLGGREARYTKQDQQN